MENQLPSEYIHKWSETSEAAQRHIHKYEYLERIANEQGNIKSEIIWLIYQADGHQKLKGIEKALELLQIAKDKTSDITESKYYDAIIQGKIGIAWLYAAKYQDAYDNLKNAWEIWQIYDDKKHQALFLLRLAEAQKQITGSFEQCLATTKKGLKLARETSQIRLISAAYLDMGFAYQNLSGPLKAMICYEKAMKMTSSTNFNHIGLAYMRMAIIYFQTEEPRKALNLYMKAMLNFDKASDRYNMGSCWINIGHIYHQLHETRQAVFSMEQAVSVLSTVLPESHPLIQQANTRIRFL